VRPEIVVQVGFLEWTGNDKLRHPRLLGVRFDKQARDVVRKAYPAEAGLHKRSS
jgi:ATP-dependent DNA ligase